MMHDNLANMFQSNFALMQHHKYSLSDLENMLPWERRLYIDMVISHVKAENEKQQGGIGGGDLDPAQFKK
jgi:3-methyladenine DNA glycosylase AlkD